MLSRLMLQFADDDLQRRFKYSRQDFYKKAIPLITALILCLSIALEIIFRVVKVSSGSLSAVTSAINWVYFAIFLTLSILIRRWVWPSWFICPLLTIIVYYYFAFVDFQHTAAVLYFT